MESTESAVGVAYERILVCVADDGLSDHAVRAAVELAERLGSELDLVHVQPDPRLLGPRFPLVHLEGWRSMRIGAAADRLRAHLEWVLSGMSLRGTPVAQRLRVLSGSPPRVVLDEAARTGADLIVIGESGKHRQLDFGGTARAVLSHATVPVWLQTLRPRPIRNILAPVDLSPYSLKVLLHVAGLARTLGAKVTALHCFSATEYQLYGMPEVSLPLPAFTLEELRNDILQQFDRAMQGFDWGGVEHDQRFIDDDPVRAVLAMQSEYDLIALGAHGHTGIAAALLGGVAYGVLRNARTPVLAIRMEPDKETRRPAAQPRPRT